jgi:hypothetical protein
MVSSLVSQIFSSTEMLLVGPRSHEDRQEGISCPHREVVSRLTHTCRNNINITSSYPRLTLDFHTNKRIVDEVVSTNYPDANSIYLFNYT